MLNRNIKKGMTICWGKGVKVALVSGFRAPEIPMTIFFAQFRQVGTGQRQLGTQWKAQRF